MSSGPRIPIDRARVVAFCRRWKINEFALFGSVLRDDFGADSDIDVLVRFAPEATWSLFDFARMEGELREIFDRDVDLIERAAVERSQNHFRRRSVLDNAEAIYVEG